MNAVSENDGNPSPLPFTPADLDGLMIGEAFQKFVVGDTEVQAAGKHLIAEDSIHREIFADGRFPGMLGDFIWPVGAGADTIAYGFAGLASPIVIHREVTGAMQRAGTIIADRWGALIKFLATGEVEAVAAEGAIPKGQWHRRNISVDIQNHDLVEEDRRERRWTGLALSAPVVVTTGVKPRPKDEAVAAALKDEGLSLKPRELTFKEIAGRIAPRMQKPCTSELEMNALAKAVKRHYERANPRRAR